MGFTLFQSELLHMGILKKIVQIGVNVPLTVVFPGKTVLSNIEEYLQPERDRFLCHKRVQTASSQLHYSIKDFLISLYLSG